MIPIRMTQKRSKYRSVRTDVDGINFHSKLEASYYSQLKLRQAAGDIRYFLRQVPIHLPGNTRYVVDFMVCENDGSLRYIDTKGMETAAFKRSKKQVEALYPITIEIVKRATKRGMT